MGRPLSKVNLLASSGKSEKDSTKLVKTETKMVKVTKHKISIQPHGMDFIRVLHPTQLNSIHYFKVCGL